MKTEEEMKYQLTIDELGRLDKFILKTNRVMTCGSSKEDVNVKHENYEQECNGETPMKKPQYQIGRQHIEA